MSGPALSFIDSQLRAPRIRRGIATKATFLVLSLVLVIFLAFSAWIFVSQASMLEASTKRTMSELGSATGLNVGNWLSGKLSLTEMGAQQIKSSEHIGQIESVIASPALTGAFVLSYFGDAAGHFYKTPKGPVAPGYDPRERGWYKSVVASKGATLSEPYVAASTQKLTITAAAPVRDETGAMIGVAANDFDLGVLSRMINEVDVGGIGYSYLVSGSGKILIHPKAALIGKPLADLLSGTAPVIGPLVSETVEGGHETLTTFVRISNLPASLDWYVALSVDREKAFASVRQLSTMLIVSTLAALLVIGLAVSQLLSRTVARPIGRLVTVLQRMAAGDIDAEIAEAARRDEIGAVGRAVEAIKGMVAERAADAAERRRLADEAAALERRRTMVELADRFENAVGGIVGMVSSSATELQATAQTLNVTATETADQSTTVAAAAEEAATNVQTVAAAAEELGASVQEIGRQVSDSATLAQSAVAEADQTARLVQELSRASARIGDVVGLISSIAGQTNLLALNATIEAARAGESGRGFAVVASEVKELASQTARATDEIGLQIAQIQTSTQEAVTAIAAIATRIRDINGMAATIAAAVEQQGAATQEIVRNITQASTGTGEVTSNIAGVAQASEETGAAASQVLASASELSRQSEHLNQEVARFLDTVRAA